MEKEKYLLAATLRNDKEKTIFKSKLTRKVRHFLNGTIVQVVFVSIGLLICKEMSIYVWTILN